MRIPGDSSRHPPLGPPPLRPQGSERLPQMPYRRSDQDVFVSLDRPSLEGTGSVTSQAPIAPQAFEMEDDRGRRREGIFRRCVRWCDESFCLRGFLRWVPLLAAACTITGLWFAIRNFLFLDAAKTYKLVQGLQPSLDQAHQAILGQLGQISRKMGLPPLPLPPRESNAPPFSIGR